MTRGRGTETLEKTIVFYLNPIQETAGCNRRPYMEVRQSEAPERKFF